MRGLLPFIDAFEPLQASVDEAAPDAKIHSFYSGVYKQFNTLLDSWQVRRPQRTACAHRPRICSSMHARAAAAAEDAPATRTPTLKRRASPLWQVEGYEAVVGEKLDFQRHVAVERVESDEPAGTILEARTKGYTLAGAVVRSAECVASLGPPEPEKPADDAAAEEAAEEGAAPAEDAEEAEATADAEGTR